MKDNRKWGNLLYIIVPVLMIISIAALSGNAGKAKKLTYSELLDLFDSNQITA